MIPLHFGFFWYERTFGRWTGAIEKFRLRSMVAFPGFLHSRCVHDETWTDAWS